MERTSATMNTQSAYPPAIAFRVSILKRVSHTSRISLANCYDFMKF